MSPIPPPTLTNSPTLTHNRLLLLRIVFRSPALQHGTTLKF